jgi:hypothetical protein
MVFAVGLLLAAWAATTVPLGGIRLQSVRGLYLGWTGKYNVGDDAMFEVCQEVLARMAPAHGMVTTLVPYYPPSSCELFTMDLNSYSFVLHGGGSILTKFEYLCTLREAAKLGIPVMVWGTGWDDEGAMGEKELELLASKSFGTGNNEDDWISIPEGAWKDTFRTVAEAKYGGVRGPYTEKILALASKTDHLKMIGDSGLLAANLLSFNPAGSSPENDATALEQLLGLTLAPNRDVLAVNYGMNKAGSSILHKDNSLVANAFIDALVTLAGKFTLVLYSMAGDDLASVQQIANSVSERVPATLKPSVMFVPTVLDTAGLLLLLRRARFSLNYKLHGSVLSSSVGTPFVAVAYHFKTIEFCDSISPFLRQFVVRTSEGDITGNALVQAMENLQQHESHVRELCLAAVDKASAAYGEVTNAFLAAVRKRDAIRFQTNQRCAAA